MLLFLGIYLPPPNRSLSPLCSYSYSLPSSHGRDDALHMIQSVSFRSFRIQVQNCPGARAWVHAVFTALPVPGFYCYFSPPLPILSPPQSCQLSNIPAHHICLSAKNVPRDKESHWVCRPRTCSLLHIRVPEKCSIPTYSTASYKYNSTMSYLTTTRSIFSEPILFMFSDPPFEAKEAHLRRTACSKHPEICLVPKLRRISK